MDDYRKFLENKSQLADMSGFEPLWLPDELFDFQKSLTDWAIRKGRGALYEECGLGKTFQQLVWAENVVRKTNKRVLVLTPLAVGSQTVSEGTKFHIDAARSRDGTMPAAKIVVTNYEQLDKFSPSDFIGVVCDECFPKGTPVDVFNALDNSLTQRYIEDIRPGDLVVNANGKDRVKAVHKRQVHRAIRLATDDGRLFECSENHPFFTVHGWRCARDLRPGDNLVETTTAMRMVRGDFPAEILSVKMGAILRNILLGEMADESSATQSQSPYCRNSHQNQARPCEMVPEASRIRRGQKRAYPIAESHDQPGNGPKDDRSENGKRHVATMERKTRRQRDRTDRAGTIVNSHSWRRLASVGCTDENGERFGIAKPLQNRLRESQEENSNRGGWLLAQQSQGTRSKEGRFPGFCRVDSVEVLEQDDPRLDQYREADGTLYFHDLEIERHPSFSVNGLLVHNSSILKNFDGKTKAAVTEFMRRLPYRLLCTATAAPNDYVELGTSSEALGELGFQDMVTRFFVKETKKDYLGWGRAAYRMRGHAETGFWRWVCSWARACRKPSDVGCDDGQFVLPELIEQEHEVKSNQKAPGRLFDIPAETLDEQREEQRRTLTERCDKVAELVDHKQPSVMWCYLNDEADRLEDIVPGAKQVSGSQSDEEKEETFTAFANGQLKKLVVKPRIGAWGLNWQHCAHMTFFPSHSFEQVYQGKRRCWRFGQKRKVKVDMVITEGGARVLASLNRKEESADRMFAGLVANMNDSIRLTSSQYGSTPTQLPSWMKGTA